MQTLATILFYAKRFIVVAVCSLLTLGIVLWAVVPHGGWPKWMGLLMPIVIVAGIANTLAIWPKRSAGGAWKPLPLDLNKKNVCRVCGKPIWGEGWNSETGERYYSHVHDNQEEHSDGSKVEPW